MAQYRSRIVIVEATQWFNGVEHPGVGVDDTGPYVTTVHEQRAYLADGDWIVPEPKPGRFYPCKPDIFAAKYEPLE